MQMNNLNKYNIKIDESNRLTGEKRDVMRYFLEHSYDNPFLMALLEIYPKEVILGFYDYWDKNWGEQRRANITIKKPIFEIINYLIGWSSFAIYLNSLENKSYPSNMGRLYDKWKNKNCITIQEFIKRNSIKIVYSDE